MIRKGKILARLVLFAGLLPAALMARTAWDPDAAAAAVTELIGSMNRIVDISENDRTMQPDAVMSKNAHAALVDIRFMIEELEQLYLALTAGRNKAQTFARYQRVSNLRDSVRDYAAEAELSEAVQTEARTSRRLLRELDLIYF